MGITLGGGKGPQAEMNVVPLIDILLVLIIIFMVITPTTPQGLNAEAPQPDPNPPQEVQPEIVVISIAKSGEVTINQQATDWDHLGDRLGEIFKRRATRVAFVWGEPEVEFREVARAIDIMRGAGIDRVGLLPASFGAPTD